MEMVGGILYALSRDAKENRRGELFHALTRPARQSMQAQNSSLD